MRSDLWKATALTPIALLVACRQDMHNQPKYKPLAATEFFLDGRSARPVIEGTVARGHMRLDPARFTGKTQRTGCHGVSVSVDTRGSRTRPGAVQHLLRSVPRPDRKRAGDDRETRVQAGGKLSHASACAGLPSGTSSM